MVRLWGLWGPLILVCACISAPFFSTHYIYLFSIAETFVSFFLFGDTYCQFGYFAALFPLTFISGVSISFCRYSLKDLDWTFLLQGWVTLQLTRDSGYARGFLSARSVTGFLSDVYPIAADELGKIHLVADERVCISYNILLILYSYISHQFAGKQVIDFSKIRFKEQSLIFQRKLPKSF